MSGTGEATMDLVTSDGFFHWRATDIAVLLLDIGRCFCGRRRGYRWVFLIGKPIRRFLTARVIIEDIELGKFLPLILASSTQSLTFRLLVVLDVFYLTRSLLGAIFLGSLAFLLFEYVVPASTNILKEISEATDL